MELAILQPRPEHITAAQVSLWNKASIRVKTAITLNFSKGPMAQKSTIIDDDEKCSKYIWYALALARLFTLSNEQKKSSISTKIGEFAVQGRVKHGGVFKQVTPYFK